jgi:hypothetical protein
LKASVDQEIDRISERLDDTSVSGAGSVGAVKIQEPEFLKSISGEHADDIITQPIPLEHTRVGHILDA